jgi:predicted Zn-dependent protease
MKTFNKPQSPLSKHNPIRIVLKWGKQFSHLNRWPVVLKRIGLDFVPKTLKYWHFWVMWGTLTLSILLSPILIDAAPNVDQKFTMSQKSFEKPLNTGQKLPISTNPSPTLPFVRGGSYCMDEAQTSPRPNLRKSLSTVAVPPSPNEGEGLGVRSAMQINTLQTLSQPQAHPMPAPLAQWQPKSNGGDYFDQVKPSPAGYLVWSQFPVKVYVAPLPEGVLLGQEKWQAAIASALQAWMPFLSLELIDQESQADIRIQGTPPKNRSSGRVRSAETRYEFYVSDRQALAHRMTIYIRPNQTEAYIKAATRHELGHALGIWGHSPSEQDTMYFSQVRNPAEISIRDINTLKHVYHQPTQLGWPVTTSN